jgi:hypothetical protein
MIDNGLRGGMLLPTPAEAKPFSILMKTPLVCLSLLSVLAPAALADFNFPNFDDVTPLQLNGTAAKVFDGSQNVLRLTPAVNSSAGSAFSKTPFSLAADASFSSVFSFRISDPHGAGADGIVFVVQTVANNVGGAGGGIGYLGIPKSVGVEFDTFDNGAGSGDLDANHVAIDTNGTFDTLGTPLPGALGDMDQGGLYYAWVDYNGATDLMEVRINNSSTRPASPLVTRTLDIPTILGATDAFVGFTAATGGANNAHDILSWGLKGNFNPFPGGDTGDGRVPEAGPLVPVVALGLAVTGWQVWRRRKQQA